MADSDKYGTTVKLRGREFQIAPLTKKQLERLWPKIVEIQKAIASGDLLQEGSVSVPDAMGLACEVILEGMHGGGHASIDLEYVESEVVDISNWVNAYLACLRVSNIKLVSGKAPALAVESQTGSQSTGT